MAALEAEQARHLQVSPWGLAAMVFVVCSAFSSQMVMPMWIGAIIADDHMTAQTAGSIASLELVMVAVVSVLAAPMVNRIDRRALCLVGVLLLMAGNAASSMARAPELLAGLRAICGVGKGLTVVGIFSAVGQMKDPTRGFAILNAAYAGFSAFYFLVIPHEIRSLGASGAFRAIFVVTSVALLLLPFVPAGRPETQVQTSTPYPWFVERRGVMVLAGLAAMWVGYNAIWIFIQQLGAQHALNLAQIGGVLSFGALLTIAGPVLAHLVATRFGLTAPLAGGFLALALASVVVVAPSGPLGFCIAAPAISLLGLFIVPYVMGLLSQIDATGKLAAVGSSAMTLGGSLGSLVGGAALTQFGDPGLLGASLVFFAIVLLLIVPVTLGIDRAVLRTA